LSKTDDVGMGRYTPPAVKLVEILVVGLFGGENVFLSICLGGWFVFEAVVG